MPSEHETFWTQQRYAVVGHSQSKPFPRLTYKALRRQGKTVYPVDPSQDSIEGDRAYVDLAALPEPVDAVVLEVPKEETASWVEQTAEAGIKQLWIHMNRDTPEALALAADRGIQVHHGTCAVMYLQGGFHKLHKWINKLAGKY